jgi:predicted nucleic acid-binding protein
LIPTAYLDTSVLIRVLLREKTALAEWNEITLGVTSQITRVECHRTIDRLWLTDVLDEGDHAAKRAEVEDLLSRIDVIPLTPEILRRASEVLPTPIGTLDAIHLVSAMSYRELQDPSARPIIMATHDRSLAAGARAAHFELLGSGG